jgi:hypothetical protein
MGSQGPGHGGTAYWRLQIDDCRLMIDALCRPRSAPRTSSIFNLQSSIINLQSSIINLQ